MYKDLEENRGMSVSHISSLSMYHAFSIHQPVWVFSLFYWGWLVIRLERASQGEKSKLSTKAKALAKWCTVQILFQVRSAPPFFQLCWVKLAVLYTRIYYLFWPSKGSLKVRSWRFMSTNAQKDSLSDKSENFGRPLWCSLWRNDINLSKVRTALYRIGQNLWAITTFYGTWAKKNSHKYRHFQVFQ